MSRHYSPLRTATAVGFFAIAVTAQAGDRPTAQDMLLEQAPDSTTIIVVPTAPARGTGGTVYYEIGDTLYGTDGSTATRYGDAIHVVPDANTAIDELLEE